MTEERKRSWFETMSLEWRLYLASHVERRVVDICREAQRFERELVRAAGID